MKRDLRAITLAARRHAFVYGIFGVATVVGLTVWTNRRDPEPVKKPAPAAVVQTAAESPQLESPKSEPVQPAPGACSGNPSETCSPSPSIDFWPTGSEDASNPELAVNSADIMKNISGRIQTITARTIVIKTSADRLFTIHFPLDVAANFNTHRSPHYDNIQVTTNDMLLITYFEPMSAGSTDIPTSKLQGADLVIRLDQGAAGPIKKY